jgi:ABC-2 type transport system permease protein
MTVRMLHVLGVATQYEFRKASAFRLGFFLREVFRGVDRGLVMSFVYVATFRSSGSATLRGWTLHEVIEYLVLATIAGKLVFHDRALDLSEQIFEGYVTKFAVMPLRYFTLVLARFIQFTAVQATVAALLATIGALALSRWWPHPEPARAAMAVVLVLLGSYCFLLAYFTLHALAFWLDVVWTLLGMVRMTCGFVMGELVPISLLPHAVESVFRCLFPYWTLCGPLEIALGRRGFDDFVRGLVVLLAWIVALQALASFTWRRGLRRYAGAGA